MRKFLNPKLQRMTTLGFVLMLAMITTISACTKKTVAHHRHVFNAFGTTVQLDIFDSSQQQAAQAFAIAERDFSYIQKTWSPWQQSALTRMNTLLQTGEWFSIAPSIKPLLENAIPLASASNHLFNPAAGEFNQLWASARENKQPDLTPDAAEIQRILNYQLRLSDIEQDGIRVRSKNPNIFLDFGAFAIGHGVNMVVEQLQKIGIARATLRVGKNFRLLGEPITLPWQTKLLLPTKTNSQGAALALEVRKNESVFSCNEQPSDQNTAAHHTHPIIDPRTGYPANLSRSAIVIHPNAATADAAATALFIAGPSQWHAIAQRMGIKLALLVDATGTIHANPAMIERLQWEPSASLIIKTSAPL